MRPSAFVWMANSASSLAQSSSVIHLANQKAFVLLQEEENAVAQKSRQCPNGCCWQIEAQLMSFSSYCCEDRHGEVRIARLLSDDKLNGGTAVLVVRLC